MVKATPELLMLLPTLLSEIRLASTPGTHPKIYRPARANAIRLTRQAVRYVIASEFSETLRQSVQASADYRKASEAKRYVVKDGCSYDRNELATKNWITE